MGFFGDLWNGVKSVGSVATLGLIPGGAAGAGGSSGGPPSMHLVTPETDPEITKMRAQLSSMPGPTPLGPETAISRQMGTYQPKDLSGPLAGYDTIRQRATEQANTQNQDTQDALARRFASMGGGPSGAWVKQASLQDDKSAQEKADTMRGIDAQESQERRGLQQAEDTKQFQSQEANKQREFQGEESLAGRNMQRDLFNADQDFKNTVFKFDSSTKLAGLDMAAKQADLDRQTSEYNMELSQYQTKHSGGLLGMGGFLGTGFGA